MITKRLLIIGLSLLTLNAHAITPYSVTVTSLLKAKDPDHLHGYRLAVGYQPESLVWDKARIYFDLSAGHWWVPGSGPYRSINIFSVAPILRSYIKKTGHTWPFVELSIGASYLSKTRLDTQNLGMHFSFQDQIGLGLAFGQEQQLAISVSALHYSNGSLCSHNSGITVPAILNINYRF